MRKGLVPIELSVLKSGMIIQEDIESPVTHIMLLRSGTVLTESIIGHLQAQVGVNKVIYVTDSTYKAITGQSYTVEGGARDKEVRLIEDSTGYTAAKNEAVELIHKVIDSKAVDKTALQAATSGLIDRVNTVETGELLTIINAIAPMDEYLQRHCINVSLLNGVFGKWLGMSKDFVDRLILVGLIHDCGKALIPMQILDAPRKLTMIEFEVIKTHTLHSYDLLYEYPEPVRLAAMYHHEKVNGKGYPRKLVHDDILLEARITSISDIYDAMVSQRAYKKARSPFSVLKMLRDISGVELDSRLVNTFIECMSQELLGTKVTMSDGTVGEIVLVDKNDIEYPTVMVNGVMQKTSAVLSCVAMY